MVHIPAMAQDQLVQILQHVYQESYEDENLVQKEKMKRNFLHKIKRRYLSVEEKEKRNESLKTNNSYSQYISQLHLGSMRLKPF